MFSSIQPRKKFSREMKTTVVSIYRYQANDFCGTISNPALEKPIPFANAMQFILLIEQLLDALGFPQRAMDLRSALPAERKPFVPSVNLSDTEYCHISPLATFELEIIFRQNASWQGSIIWVKENTVFTFRSVLELLLLTDSILTDIAPEES